MNEQSALDEKLDVAAGVLIRCFVMGLVCMIIWLVAVVAVADWAYRIHSTFIPISREQFNLVHYAGLILLKVAVFGLFLLPYIGIKLVQKKRKG